MKIIAESGCFDAAIRIITNGFLIDFTFCSWLVFFKCLVVLNCWFRIIKLH